MIQSLTICLFTSLLVSIVSSQSKTNSGLIVLNLYKSFSELKEIPLSHFIDEIKFIPLETNPKALISNLIVNYEIISDYIIVRQYNGEKHQILLFDRETGKFIREIGTQGRGPGEFARWSYLPFNPVKHELYALNYSLDILVYDLSGKNIDIIKTPYIPDPEMDKPITNPEVYSKSFQQMYCILDSDIFVGYFQNFSGTEVRKIILLSKDKIIKIFPNYLTWDRDEGIGFMVPPGGFAKFYKWDNKVNFLEIFCDTLYEVTKERMIPRFYFDTGPYKAEYSKQIEVASKWYNYFLMVEIKENSKYIFFRFSFKKQRYLGFIEKKDNTITICKISPSGNSAFIDDISNMMDVVPDHFTQNNEMIYIIEPAKLMNWFKTNPEKAEQSINKNPWLKNIDEFSNPIIAIGKCK